MAVVVAYVLVVVSVLVKRTACAVIATVIRVVRTTRVDVVVVRQPQRDRFKISTTTPFQAPPLPNAQTNDICDEGDRVAEQALSEWASPHLNSRNVLKAHTANVKDGPLAG